LLTYYVSSGFIRYLKQKKEHKSSISIFQLQQVTIGIPYKGCRLLENMNNSNAKVSARQQ